MIDRRYKCSGHIGCMNVMNRLHPKVWHQKLLPPLQREKDFKIKVALGIDRIPPGPHQMSWMQDCDWKSVSSRFAQKIPFNLGLSLTIDTKGPSRLGFGSRQFYAVTVNPNRATVKKMLYPSSQRFREQPCALWQITGQVDHTFRVEGGDPFPKSTRSLLLGSVTIDLLNLLPRCVGQVGRSQTTADRYNLVTRLHEHGCEVGSYMSSTADDNNTHVLLLSNIGSRA